MFEKKGKQMNISALAAPLGLAMGLTLAIGQPANAGNYLENAASSSVVSNAYGECWHSVEGMTQMVPECGDAMPKKEMPMMPKDSDGDGVPDGRDRCPNTPHGVRVDANGCPKDSDGDGVPDYLDRCPGTRPGAKVNAQGCEITPNVTINLVNDEFDFDSAALKPDMKTALDDVAAKIKASPGQEMLTIIGYTDSTGPEIYNQGLSERRAKSVAEYLAGEGIPPASMTVMGKGETQPIADNGTRAGRAKNRRVEIETR